MEQPSNDDSKSLLMLNNDCLFHILSFLNFWELLRVEKVCERFAEVAQQIYNSYTSLNLSGYVDGMFVTQRMNIRMPEVMAIASKVQTANIHTLTVGSSTFMTEYIPKEFICTYFKNLKNIHMYDFHIRDEDTKELAIAFEGVVGASLNDCFFKEDYLNALFKFEQLEILKLPKSANIKGQFLARLRNIRELSLDNCYSIDRQLFRQFCEEHPNLQSLNLIDCSWIDKSSFQSIASNLRNLETIKISADYGNVSTEDYFILAVLPKLKHLQVTFYPDDIHNANMDKVLLKFSAYDRLEVLELVHKMSITKETEKALASFTKLKKLRLLSSWIHTKLKDSTLLESLRCENTLEHLEIPDTNVTPQGLELLIKRCPSLRILNMEKCLYDNVLGEFFSQILVHLKDRSHMLEIRLGRSIAYTNNKYKKDFRIFSGINPTKLMVTFE